MILSGYLVMYIDYTYIFFLINIYIEIRIYGTIYIYNYIQLIFGKKSPLCLHIITIHRLPKNNGGCTLGPWSHISCRFFGVFSPSKPSWTWPAMWPHQTVLTWPGHLGGQTAWGQQPCKTDGTKIDSRSWFTRWSFQMFLCSPPPGEMLC